MKVFLVTLLAASTCVLTDSRTVPQVHIDGFQPMCSRKCHESQDYELINVAFPRYRCSCSQSCAVYGDCCYDSTFKNTTNRPQFNFVCLSVVGRGRYRAVSSCPPSKRSDFCWDGLGHLPPVTSASTNVTYGNIFCASCNDDGDNLVMWNVELRCPSEKENETDSAGDETSRIIYYSDEFWRLNEADNSKRLCKYHVHFDDFKVLDELELRTCSTTNLISRCSTTWTDLTIMEKCWSYEDPVYLGNFGFRNSHCARCNYLNTRFADCIPFGVRNMLEMKLVDQAVVDFCRNRGSRDCLEQLMNTGKGIPKSITQTLSILQTECVPPKGKSCCEGLFWDFRTKMCRRKVKG